jgi:hypothetical protein
VRGWLVFECAAFRAFSRRLHAEMGEGEPEGGDDTEDREALLTEKKEALQEEVEAFKLLKVAFCF